MPAPDPRVSFSAGVLALERIEQARKQREDQMRNALEILESHIYPPEVPGDAVGSFVKRVAREGLGHA